MCIRWAAASRDRAIMSRISKDERRLQLEREAAGDHLYANRVRVYPKSVHGPVRRVKWAMLIVCLTIYYLLPWLRWHRGPGQPSQAVLLDLWHERFYFFDMELWPQDIWLLAGALICGAVCLFLVTSLFGRLWCGYTCPQTVWTDLFMWVEQWVEGDRNERMQRDADAVNADTAWKKFLKHWIWFWIAFWTGGAWIMYYVDAPTVTVEFWTGQASSEVYFFTFLFTATTYLLAGWAREQVCTYMCPWPRFQSAMLDDQSFTVTYQSWRGEPRKRGKRLEDAAPAGDCVDCGACVTACPTGHRHPRRHPVGVHQLRAVHRCLQPRDGADASGAVADHLGHRGATGREEGGTRRTDPHRPAAHHHLSCRAGDRDDRDGHGAADALDTGAVGAARPGAGVRAAGGWQPAQRLYDQDRQQDTGAWRVRPGSGRAAGRDAGHRRGRSEAGAGAAAVEVHPTRSDTFRVLVTARPTRLANGSQPVDFVLRDTVTGQADRLSLDFHGSGGLRRNGGKMNTTVWRWFPHAMIAALGLVIVVNLYMVYDAYHTFPGVAGRDGFDLSNEYDRVLATAQRQTALGWQIEAEVADGRFPVLRLTDRTGAPLRGDVRSMPCGAAGGTRQMPRH